MDIIEQVQKNRAIVLATLRDPEMEEWHIRDSYFDPPINSCETPPAPKTCPACALGVAALALGFTKFSCVKPGEYDEENQCTNDAEYTYWTWSDDAACRFVQDQTNMNENVASHVIQMNDAVKLTLAQIADDLQAMWESGYGVVDE